MLWILQMILLAFWWNTSACTPARQRTVLKWNLCAETHQGRVTSGLTKMGLETERRHYANELHQVFHEGGLKTQKCKNSRRSCHHVSSLTVTFYKWGGPDHTCPALSSSTGNKLSWHLKSCIYGRTFNKSRLPETDTKPDSVKKKKKERKRDTGQPSINKFGPHKSDKCILTSEIRPVCSHITSLSVVSGLTNWFSDHLGACACRFTLHRRIRIKFEALNFCDTSYQFSVNHPS